MKELLLEEFALQKSILEMFSRNLQMDLLSDEFHVCPAHLKVNDHELRHVKIKYFQ